MIIPTKHQNLKSNPLIIGADILYILKSEKEILIEDLYQKMKTLEQLDLNIFFDTLTFLWLIDSIDINKGIIQKKICI